MNLLRQINEALGESDHTYGGTVLTDAEYLSMAQTLRGQIETRIPEVDLASFLKTEEIDTDEVKDLGFMEERIGTWEEMWNENQQDADSPPAPSRQSISDTLGFSSVQEAMDSCLAEPNPFEAFMHVVTTSLRAGEPGFVKDLIDAAFDNEEMASGAVSSALGPQ